MDYTLSPQHVVHPGTGHRMHEDSQALATMISDADFNSVIWSLMEVVGAAGLAGQQFDPGTPGTYQVVRNAIAELLRRGYGSVGVATGTPDALVVTLAPAPMALVNGMKVRIRAIATNETTTPTLEIAGLVAKTIVKGNGQPLAAGDIAGSGHWIELQFDQALDVWALMNPATGVSPAAFKMLSVNASVAANALTLTLNPGVLDFRSATLTSGVPNTRAVQASISLTVPPGATLGTVNATQARLALVAIDNVGTVELAVANLAGGVNLDETTLISTTAISAGATAANVVYSTTARVGVPFRVVGFVDITEAAAGTWVTAPSVVQGAGGQGLAAMSSLGYGQSWQFMTGSRAIGTTYYNTTGRPIFVSVRVVFTGTNGYLSALVGGVDAGSSTAAFSATLSSITFIVPPGSSYRVDNNNQPAGTLGWLELR